MDENTFWELLHQAKVNADQGEHDDQYEWNDAFCDFLYEALEARPLEDLIDFEYFFDVKLAVLTHYDIWGAGYCLNGGCSSDMFMDFRAWIISQGREVCEAVLANPDNLAQYVDRNEDREYDFESLWAVASAVYENRTGKEIPARPIPEELRGRKGEEWDFDDPAEFARRLPNLQHGFRNAEDWERCHDDVHQMCLYLKDESQEETYRGRGSRRTFLLLAAAIARRIWEQFAKPERQVVLTAEQVAEGQASEESLLQALDNLLAYRETESGKIPRSVAHHFGLPNIVPEIAMLVSYALRDFTEGRATQEDIASVKLTRDIMGNPFLDVTPSETWFSLDVRAIAQRIYDTQDFTDMPILADALEEAGCNNSYVLSHCRENIAHVRGCWVVDMVLGK